MAFSKSSYVFISADSSQLAKAAKRFFTPLTWSVSLLGSRALTCPHAVPLQSMARRGASMGRSFSGQIASKNLTFSTYSRTLSTAGSKLGSRVQRCWLFGSSELPDMVLGFPALRWLYGSELSGSATSVSGMTTTLVAPTPSHLLGLKEIGCFASNHQDLCKINRNHQKTVLCLPKRTSKSPEQTNGSFTQRTSANGVPTAVFLQHPWTWATYVRKMRLHQVTPRRCTIEWKTGHWQNSQNIIYIYIIYIYCIYIYIVYYIYIYMIIIDYTAHIHNFIYTFFLRQVADPTLKAATILCVCVSLLVTQKKQLAPHVLPWSARLRSVEVWQPPDWSVAWMWRPRLAAQSPIHSWQDLGLPLGK